MLQLWMEGLLSSLVFSASMDPAVSHLTTLETPSPYLVKVFALA